MDIQRKNVGRNKAIRWTIIGIVTVGVVLGLFFWVKGLKPAAPPAEMSALWPDTVKRGPMVREVRGLGTLVPEDTMLITANTDALSLIHIYGKSLPENAPLAAQQLQRLDRSGLPALGSFEAHEYPKPLPCRRWKCLTNQSKIYCEPSHVAALLSLSTSGRHRAVRRVCSRARR